MKNNAEVKQKIESLDAAHFQELCDFITKLDYPEYQIIQTGMNIKGQTIKGTPDSLLFGPDGYICVEATIIKTNIYNKIKSDIEKCLGLKIKEKIRIIIYHSGKLKIEEIADLKKMVKENTSVG